MPIIKSAKKRVRVARKATVRNSKTKRSLRTALKSFQSAISGGKKTTASHSKVQSALDKAGKKGVLHKNKVARKKKQASVAAKKAAGIKKPTGTKKPAPAMKPAVKKAAPKKVVAKKPAAKKPAPKKK